MDAFSGDFHDVDMEKMAQLANSKQARQLFSLLGGQNNPQLRAAMEHAATGDMTQAKNILQNMASDPQIMTLLQQMMGDRHG
jgi:hypothetical protein